MDRTIIIAEIGECFNGDLDIAKRPSKGDKTIGDFSEWRQKLNYFDDFKAPERVGRFIQTFMDEIIKTDNMENSLDFAVKQYIEENKIEEDFFKIEDWWEDELGEINLPK